MRYLLTCETKKVVKDRTIGITHTKLIDAAHKLAEYDKSLALKYGDGISYNPQLLRRSERIRLDYLRHKRDSLRAEFIALSNGASKS